MSAPAGGADIRTPMTIVGLLSVVWASTYVFIAAGSFASFLAGEGFAVPAAGTGVFRAPVAAVRDGAGSQWPGVPAALVWAVTGLIVAAILAAVVAVAVRFGGGRPDDPLRSLAQPGEVRDMMLPARRSEALRLRPSLLSAPASKTADAQRAGVGATVDVQSDTAAEDEQRGAPRRPARVAKTLAPVDVGLPLGRLRRVHGRPRDCLYSSWEDVMVAFMAPRAGKTTAFAIPYVLDAPGAVVATSNKADLVASTTTLRAERTGEQVWVFDPLGIAGTEQTWWWNPLRLVDDDRAAARLASHFIQEVASEGKDKFWSSAAEDVLTALILAAAVADRSLVEVSKWASQTSMDPYDLLLDAGHDVIAASYRGRLEGAEQTVQGILENVRTSLRCLRSRSMQAWVTPPASTADVADVPGGPAAGGGKVPELFREEEFVTSRQCLQMLSTDRDGAAPLIAAFVDSILHVGMATAEAVGGRLDAPMTLVLDEAANICKIRELPNLYSHLGSRGIVPVTILQSYPQGVRVWGKDGMAALWSAATVKVIGSGIDDRDFAETVSVLLDEHDVATSSHSRSSSGRSDSTSTRRQRVMTPGQVRKLAKGTALVLATGRPAAWVETNPSYKRRDASEIERALNAFEVSRTRRLRDVRGAGVPTSASSKSPATAAAPATGSTTTGSATGSATGTETGSGGVGL